MGQGKLFREILKFQLSKNESTTYKNLKKNIMEAEFTWTFMTLNVYMTQEERSKNQSPKFNLRTRKINLNPK